jgi:hypothetical protein
LDVLGFGRVRGRCLHRGRWRSNRIGNRSMSPKAMVTGWCCSILWSFRRRRASQLGPALAEPVRSI